MNIIKLAAFSDRYVGGNPAGVVLLSTLPSSEEMQAIARDVGFSETVFAQKLNNDCHWRIRYFSPESEVAFCGHATIALGAALANQYGEQTYYLTLNNASITVTGSSDSIHASAALQSPPTHHSLLSDEEVDATLELFGYHKDQLSSTIAPARIHGGADHYLIVLESRQDLAMMHYELDKGREFMRSRKLVTVMLAVEASHNKFHARNAFASGGVFEDPATGAAAAAFAGYLRDSRLIQSNGKIEIIQGEDMGARSIISTEFTTDIGSSITISGSTRRID